MRPGDPFYSTFLTLDYATTGNPIPQAPTSGPSAVLRRNGVTDAGVSVSISNNSLGDYLARGTIPAAYSGGDRLELVVSYAMLGYNTKLLIALGDVDRTLPDEPRVYVNSTGTNWYVSTTGSDGNTGTSASPFGTIAHAISVASAGDCINLGTGTFALGNAVLNLPDGVSITGAGQRLTVISSTADLNDKGCIVCPGNGSVVSHLAIACVGVGVYQGPFGFNGAATSAQSEKTNWALDDVYTTGDSDGLFIHGTAVSPPVVRGIVRNCVFRSKYDTVNVFANASSWDILIDFVNPNFAANGPSIVGAGAFTARALAIGIGAARVFGGVLEASGNTGGSATNNAVNVDGGAKVELYQSLLISSGDNAKDIGVGTGTCIVSGVAYTPAKTSGTITVRPTSATSTPFTSFNSAVTLASVQNFNNAGQTTPLPTSNSSTNVIDTEDNVYSSAS